MAEACRLSKMRGSGAALLRDAKVSLTKVSAIAGAFESVSRDHKTGEILCGGYVSNHITTVM